VANCGETIARRAAIANARPVPAEAGFSLEHRNARMECPAMSAAQASSIDHGLDSAQRQNQGHDEVGEQNG
jgi:hypothetical protein